MGKVRGPYEAEFPVGSCVRIADKADLEEFVRPRWRLHHPLMPEQLECAGTIGKVESVGYYHGGDELYKLIGIQGTWHEENLSAWGWAPEKAVKVELAKPIGVNRAIFWIKQMVKRISLRVHRT